MCDVEFSIALFRYSRLSWVQDKNVIKRLTPGSRPICATPRVQLKYKRVGSKSFFACVFDQIFLSCSLYQGPDRDANFSADTLTLR